MIVDLTESFYEYASSSRTAYTQSNWHASGFIKTSTSYLCDLNLLDSKLSDLQKMIRAGGRFEKEAQTNKIVNVKEHLKLCEQNIKRLKGMTVDIKSKRQMAEKLRQSILITMELRLLTATFKFKDIHLAYAKKSGAIKELQGSQTVGGREPQREINLSRSHFLEQSQGEVLQEVATREYKQIEKSIHEISEMYKETMNVVRMHQLLIDSIESHIDDADENVQGGRRNLSEINSKQQKNRKFIYKVFGLLYFIVFVYLVVLS